jgi:hypothetical protein
LPEAAKRLLEEVALVRWVGIEIRRRRRARRAVVAEQRVERADRQAGEGRVAQILADALVLVVVVVEIRIPLVLAVLVPRRLLDAPASHRASVVEIEDAQRHADRSAASVVGLGAAQRSQ